MITGYDIKDVALSQKIGEGAFGEVWLAEDLAGQHQAAKIISIQTTSRLLSDMEWKGLQHYTEISRAHEELLTIYRLGRESEFLYYLMELADPVSDGWNGCAQGDYQPKTLKWLIANQGRLERETCLSYAISLAKALGFFHQNGLIHRDIKPSNIVIVGGRLKLADIGLVRVVNEEISLAGTEGYLPPEGARNHQSDIYSLGMVFFQMLTGEPISSFPKWPVQEGQSMPVEDWTLEFNAIISRCTSPLPAERYASVDQLLDDLTYLQQGLSPVRRANRRRWLKVAALGVSLIMMIPLLFHVFRTKDGEGSQVTMLPEIIPSTNWDFSQGNVNSWELLQWPGNMQIIEDQGATGGYYYQVEEWNQGATIATPVFKATENARLHIRYMRSGPSSCEVFVLAASDHSKLLTLAVNEMASKVGFAVHTFDLSEFAGQDIQICAGGGSVRVDYMYVEQLVESKQEPEKILLNGDLAEKASGEVSFYPGSLLGSVGELPESIHESLIAFFPFNGSAENAMDPKQKVQVLKVSKTSDRFSQMDRAAYFDGSESIIEFEANDTFLNLENEVTLTLWIRPDGPGASYSDGQDLRHLFGSSSNLASDPGGGFILRLIGSGSAMPYAHLHFMTSKPFGSELSDQRVLDGQWQWVAASIRGDTMRLYINSKPSLTMESLPKGLTKGVLNHDQRFSMGQSLGTGLGNPQGFKGCMDDLGIYNRALSQREIEILYDLESSADR